MKEQTIFDIIYPEYKIKKPIRLIEFFAGYGSQALALKYLDVPFEHWKICEWAVKSIQAYKDIHFTNEDYKEPGMVLEKDDLVEILYHYEISSNYNEPMFKEQIKRLNYDKLWQIYKNIKITHNLVNIQQVNGKDLEIKDTDKFTYLLTYSFPCQDLSSAGKGKGMSDTSTRSGMLWEVERILIECKELGEMPEVLLMENVPQVHSEDNKADFLKWITRLEELGYKNYFEDLIATDYGIPQTRNRCFMVSVLGDYSYSFPPKQELKLRLKDMLEDEVDEKYFLSDKMIKCFTRDEKGKFPRGERFKQALKQTNENNLAGTITTAAGNRATDNFIITNKSLKETLEQNTKEIKDGSYIDSYNKTIRNDGLSSTITTRVDASNNSYIAIEVVGTYQFSKSNNFMQGKDRFQAGKDVSDTILTTPKEAVVYNNLAIRKLTPKECFRLMGVKDEDFENCTKTQSDASLYHLAGDSIVVNVLMAIFSQML